MGWPWVKGWSETNNLLSDLLCGWRNVSNSTNQVPPSPRGRGVQPGFNGREINEGIRPVTVLVHSKLPRSTIRHQLVRKLQLCRDVTEAKPSTHDKVKPLHTIYTDTRERNVCMRPDMACVWCMVTYVLLQSVWMIIELQYKHLQIWKKVADCASRSPAMQRLWEILTTHKLFSTSTSCWRSAVVLHTAALTTPPRAAVRRRVREVTCERFDKAFDSMGTRRTGCRAQFETTYEM